MRFETLLFERRGAVATITLNRPQAANALNPAMAADLAAAAVTCDADRTIRAVVLTGAGDRLFCGGGDLMAFAAAGDGARAMVLEMTKTCIRAVSRFARLDAPGVGGPERHRGWRRHERCTGRRPPVRGRSRQAHHGLHTRGSLTRRELDLLPRPYRRLAASCRAYVAQPRAERGGSEGMGPRKPRSPRRGPLAGDARHRRQARRGPRRARSVSPSACWSTALPSRSIRRWSTKAAVSPSVSRPPTAVKVSRRFSKSASPVSPATDLGSHHRGAQPSMCHVWPRRSTSRQPTLPAAAAASICSLTAASYEVRGSA